MLKGADRPLEIATISAWAEMGAAEGDAKDRPAPVTFNDGWTIGTPDVVVTMPKDVELPATGVIDQQNVLVYAHFEKDMWVKAAEVRPGENPRAVHHMKAWIRPPNSLWMKDAPEGVLYSPPRGAPAAMARRRRRHCLRQAIAPCRTFSRSTTRASKGRSSAPERGKVHRGRSDIVFEVHYTATGKPETDRLSVGIVLAGGPPRQRHLTTTAISARDFEIPAGAPDYEIRGETTVNEPAKLVWIQPHMHYRARNYELTVVYPSGKEKTILRVPNYRFDWQVGYELAEPWISPRARSSRPSRTTTTHPRTSSIPDPTKNVRDGAQSWDEMHVTFVGILIDAKDESREDLCHRPPAGTAGSGMNKQRLFVASCLSIATASMVFAIRGDVAGPLSQAFHITNEQMGLVFSPAFWAFTIAIFISGNLVDIVGMRRLHILSAAGFIVGVALIVLAPHPTEPVVSLFDHTGTTLLYAGFFMLGLSHGLVEGVINPLMASLYPDEKTRRITSCTRGGPPG